ncbi:MAG: M81 family metallopeptidase [Rhizobiales bacterium]|nr:M81 family metallopeptidase [Hyphomicrobiales bacterium]
MARILIAECIQEISSFNPKPSAYANFRIQRGDEVLMQRGEESAIGGALKIFAERPEIKIIPAYSAEAESAGLLSAEGWQHLATEFLDSVAARIDEADAIYVSMHGAMAADGELDPEGFLLERIRDLAGPTKPLVISLDLHGILTDRMLRPIEGVVMYHTYPHVDMKDTGQRAARLLLDIIDRRLRPTIVRVTIPALVRGDELITRTGCYGDLIREVRRLEGDGTILAGGIMIGNPFTDVPELGSQIVLVAAGDAEQATDEAARIAREFWSVRHRMQGKLISVERAVLQARSMAGPVAFTDAADAPSSGASGDSNAIIRVLRESGYSKRVLAQILDPAAAKAAHEAGVGAEIKVRLGGSVDRRFTPMEITATVETLTRGVGRYETWPGVYNAGLTAVLAFDNFTLVVISRPVALVDRSLYYASGIDPEKFDLIVIKSPHCEYRMFDAWVEKNFNVDAPGATSANLKSLGHSICQRPVYPLDENVSFEPKPVRYVSRLHAQS